MQMNFPGNSFDSIFHNHPSAILVADPETGMVEYANPAACAFYGYEPGQFTAAPLEELRRAPRAQERQAEMQCGSFSDGGRPLLLVIVHDRTSMGMETSRTETQPIQTSREEKEEYVDRTAELAGTIDFLREEIIERGRVEEKLREQSYFLQTLIDTIPLPIFYKDCGGRYLGCNAAFSRYIGVSKEKIIGERVSAISSSPLAKVYREMDLRLLSERGIQVYQTTIVNAEGIEKTVIMNKATFCDSNGELAGIIGTIFDVTDRQEMENALRDSERKYRSLFEESRDVIYEMADDGTILDMNMAGIELFGYSYDELLRLNMTRDMYRDPAKGEGFLDKLLSRGYVKNEEQELVRKDGEILPVQVSAVTRRNEEGEAIGFWGIIHDISEAKKLQEQLLQSQKLESIGQLAAGIAHDFNNLLTVIIGYGEVIHDYLLEDEDELLAKIDLLLAAAAKAADLTGGLLAFSRKQILNPKPMLLNELIGKASNLFVRIIGEDIAFITDLAGDCPAVVADAARIEQVLVNLVSNARDAMPEGGKLRICTRNVSLTRTQSKRQGLEPGKFAVVTVADTGRGMKPADCARVFEPFFTTKEMGKGAGLGLSVSYGIVRQHKGALNVQSSPGKGTIFTIYLPAAEGVGARSAIAADVYVGNETILLAEDDLAVRRFLTEQLREAGYGVIAAADGDEAISLFAQHRDSISLVLTDVVMPGKNGSEISEIIAAQAPATKFIFISGYTGDLLDSKGLSGGSFHFLKKPVGKSELLQKVREVLDRT